MGNLIEERYGVPKRRLNGLMSPWCLKRLDEFNGRYLEVPRAEVAAVAAAPDRRLETEPATKNNQDISSLVGKVDIRKLEMHAQNDPDAYSYSGGLNRSNQGLLEFVEMFNGADQDAASAADATQEGNYIGYENIGAIHFRVSSWRIPTSRSGRRSRTS